jgi:RNA 2',3'-cyclic 3'-phosphodiesterase
MYRLFIALDLPDEVKDDLANICFGIPGAKWVPKDQMHLTVRFIGDISEQGYHAVASALSDVVASSFSIDIKSVGYFPPHNNPKLLWVGIEKNGPIMDLRKAVEACLRQADVEPEERKFAAHITLARLGPNTPIRAIADFLSAHGLFKIGSIAVKEFYLYSSVLTPSGAVHRKEATYTLI